MYNRALLGFIFVLGTILEGQAATDIICQSGTKESGVTLLPGDVFKFNTAGRRYSSRQQCSADYTLDATCSQASISCSKFRTIANKKCTRGDFVIIKDSAGNNKRFCRKNGPVEYQPTGDFSIKFVSDGRRTSAGLRCTVSCPEETGSTAASPATTASTTAAPPASSTSPTAAPPATSSTPTESIDCPAGCQTQIKINQVWAQEVNGYERTAEVLIPATATKLPVVIDLHGSGGKANTQRLGSFLTKSIIVAPQGYLNQWNIVKENSKAPDVAFMIELLKQVAGIQQADMDDVTLFGTSNGAGYIYRLLIETRNARPFKRVIPTVSCMAFQQNHDDSFWTPANQDNTGENIYDQAIVPDSPGPEVIYLHGTEDNTVPYEEGQSLGLTFLGAQKTTFLLAKAFGYTGTQIADSAGTAVQTGITKYEYTTTGNKVTHYKMQDMGHNAFDALYRVWVKNLLLTTIEA
jgi:poly(3-hydroxybutyrate) depolymerase